MKSQIPFLVLILFVFLIGSCFATNSKDEFLKLLKTRSQFEKEMKFVKNVLRSTKTLQDIGDMSVECKTKKIYKNLSNYLLVKVLFVELQLMKFKDLLLKT